MQRRSSISEPGLGRGRAISENSATTHKHNMIPRKTPRFDDSKRRRLKKQKAPYERRGSEPADNSGFDLSLSLSLSCSRTDSLENAPTTSSNLFRKNCSKTRVFAFAFVARALTSSPRVPTRPFACLRFAYTLSLSLSFSIAHSSLNVWREPSTSLFVHVFERFGFCCTTVRL